ncbi:hypothetical protein [Embleya hyalina]|uniref:Uncharacterized protein n=1 Tax=Embleya hyalina TaxID=516124 RepID=A0A401YHN5_9ACTN|nr:hypothetical protein [Embleya hyalina]GCD94080.1 hypothetical protein EHYA_01736 [Embleya hyalina]
MTVRVSWLYPSPAGPAGGQSREDTRLSPIGTMWPTGPTTTRSGVIPGGSPLALSGSGMTATIGLGRAVVQGTAAQGAYAAAVTAPHAVTLANGHASLPRIDVIALRVYDTVYDASGQSIGDVVVVKGTEAASPTAPAMPSPTTMPLYQITVPAGASAGTGGLTWGGATDLRVWTVAAGGVLPDPAGTAPGGHTDQLRIRAGRIERWTGSAWTELDLPSLLAASTWGAWTAYTPTWTAQGGSTALGTGGSISGAYCRTGRMITARIAMKIGTSGYSGGTGSWRWSLPVTPVLPAGALMPSGIAHGQDAGVANYTGVADLTSSGIEISSHTGIAPWNPTLPFTWGVNDLVGIQVTYEATS